MGVMRHRAGIVGLLECVLSRAKICQHDHCLAWRAGRGLGRKLSAVGGRSAEPEGLLPRKGLLTIP